MERLARQDVIARALARLLDEHGYTHQRLADECGVPRQFVDDWCDVEADKNMSIADGRGIVEAGLRDAVALLVAGEGRLVVERPVADAAPMDLEHAAQLSRASLALVDSLLLSIAHRHAPVDVRELDRRAALVERDIAALRASCAVAAEVPAPARPLRRTA